MDQMGIAASRQGILTGRAFAGRRWLIAVVLVAFALQSFIVQTHVHPRGYAEIAATAHAGTPAPKHDNYPGGDDSSNCPLCKEIAYHGQFVTPGWAVYFLPAMAVSLIETATLSRARPPALSHIWSSRAPPRR